MANPKKIKKRDRKAQKESLKKDSQEHGKKSPDWMRFAYPAILFIAFLITYNSVFDSKLDLGGDNAAYYILGKALSQAKGYVNINNINESPANHFPPGYPAIISVVITIVNDEVVTVKIANGVMLFLSLLVLFQVFQSFLKNKNLALVTTLLILFNTHFLRYSTIMMSEISYVLFSFLSLWIFIKMDKDKFPLKNTLFYLLIITLSISYYIRTAGVAIFGAIILYLLLHKNWKYIVSVTAGYLLLALPWFIRGQMLGGNAYVKQLLRINPYRPELGQVGVGDVFIRIWENFARYVTKEIPTSTLPFFEVQYVEPTGGEWLIGLILVGLIIYGVYQMPRYKWLMISLLVCNFGILLLWPDVWYGVRFILPVAPLLLFSMLVAIYMLVSKPLAKSNVKFQPLILIVIALPFFSQIKKLSEQANEPPPPQWRNYFQLAEYAKKNTPEDAVICCRKPNLFYVFADRYTTYYRNLDDQQEFIQMLDDRQVDYVVLEQLGFGSTGRYLYPVIRDNPQMFPVVYQIPAPDTYLMQFKPEQ